MAPDAEAVQHILPVVRQGYSGLDHIHEAVRFEDTHQAPGGPLCYIQFVTEAFPADTTDVILQ